MSTTALQFGPEWMRKAPLSTPTSAVPPSTTTLKPERGLPSTSPAASMGSPLPSTAAQALQEAEGRSSSYSSILSDFGQGPVTPVMGIEEDGGRPFRYSKEQMVSVWREGGGRGDLPIDVERWEGVTQEEGREPEAVREWNDEERRFFTGPVNSEPPRRRADTLSNSNPLSSPIGERPPRERRDTFGKLGDGGPSSPMREKFGTSGAFTAGLRGRRREDGAADVPPPLRARNSSFGQSLTGANPPAPGGLAGPRRGMGTFDGVLGSASNREEGVWQRRKAPEAGGPNGTGTSSAFGERRRPLGQGSGSTEGSGNATVVWSTGGGAAARHGSGDDAPIPEEADSEHLAHAHHQPVEQPSHTGMPLSPSPEPMVRSYEPERVMNGMTTGMGGLSLSADQQSVGLGMDSVRGGPSPDIPRTTSTSSISPENVNWYYKDPTGQMQGPFPATTMQEWYEGQYFPEDLLLRRDGDDVLEPLHELKRRANPMAKLFLSVIPPRAPPNLPPAPQPIPQPFASMQSPSILDSNVNPIYGTPNYSNMDTFASSPIVTQQPGYGIPHRQPSLDNFAPISPVVPSSVRQPSPRHTIDAIYASDSTPFGAIGSSALERERARQRERDEFLRREALLAQQQHALAPGAPLQRNGYPNGAINRDSIYDSSPAPIGNLQRMLSESSNISHPMDQQQYMPAINAGNFGPRFQSPMQSAPIEQSHGFPMQMQQQMQPQGSPWGSAPQIQYQQPTTMQPSFDPAIISSSPQIPGPRSPFEPPPQPQYQQGISFGQQEHMQELQQAPQAPWQTQQYQQQPQEHWAPLPSQPAPVTSAPEHTAHVQDTMVPPSESEPVEVPQPSRPMPIPQPEPVHEPVVVASPKVVAPIARLRGESLIQSPPKAAPVSPEVQGPVTLPAPISVPSPAAPIPAPIASPVAAVAPAAPITTVPTPPSSISVPKPAPWAAAASPVDEKAKAGAATSLRQIQEAEAKKAEARKAAEKAERAKRAAATATSPAVEEAVPTTQSWGLAAPVGTRAPAPVPEPPAVAAPWSKTGPAPKKTLKEIQEEEEKRKSQAAAAAAAAAANQGLPAAAAAAKRGYADSAKTSGPVGGVWSTVGPGGKVSGVPAGAPVRPAAITQASTPAVRPAAAPVAAATTIRSVSATQLAKTPTKAGTSTAGEGEAPVPSADFMRWLRDSLKGLNTGVNVDEYMQMLLSFPLDPSPAVVEIIQESIYGNSPTLDGRRFAAEFIAKRKADAAAKKAGTSSGTVKASLADVVKTQPKSASPDWNFKTVVKKKGKGKN